jgi:hypothetical protein
MDQRQALKPRALLLSIDRLLERLYPTRPGALINREGAPQNKPLPPTSVLGWILVASTLLPGVAVSVLWK